MRPNTEPSRSFSYALLAAGVTVLSACAIGVTPEELQSEGSPSRVDASEEEEIEEPEEEEEEPAPDAGSQTSSSPSSGDSGGAAGTATNDAGFDAGSSAGTRDAGLDASATPRVDAGVDASTPPRQDAGSQNPPRDAGRDSGGGGTPGGGGMCNPDTCTNNCGISAPFRCCENNGTCGCSWFPIAYCNS